MANENQVQPVTDDYLNDVALTCQIASEFTSRITAFLARFSDPENYAECPEYLLRHVGTDRVQAVANLLECLAREASTGPTKNPDLAKKLWDHSAVWAAEAEARQRPAGGNVEAPESGF